MKMKSGKKVEPNPKAISPGRVSTIGNKQMRTVAPEPMVKGRGFKAPTAASTVHKSGTQGKR